MEERPCALGKRGGLWRQGRGCHETHPDYDRSAQSMSEDRCYPHAPRERRGTGGMRGQSS